MRRDLETARLEAVRLVARYVEPPMETRPRGGQDREDPQVVADRRAFRELEGVARLEASVYEDLLVGALMYGDNTLGSALARSIAARESV